MSRAGREHVGRVERAQLGRVVGPAERRERPQARREPRVEHVGVLLPAVALGRLRADVASRPRRGTRRGSGGPTRAGARCTRAGCSRASRGSACAGSRGGRAARPSCTASIAGAASSSISRTTAARSAARSARRSGASTAPRACRARSRAIAPCSRSAATTASRASSGVKPAKRSPASSFMRPSSPITMISSSPCARPISKSFGSCPGVIFSAPVPNSGLTYGSAMIRSRRPTSGRIAVSPTSRV